MCKEKSSIGFGLGLIAGVVGGIIGGILCAPCPGSEMRAKVKDTVCDLAEKYSPEVQEAKKQALESIDVLKCKLENQYKKFGDMIKSKKLRKAKELESSILKQINNKG